MRRPPPATLALAHRLARAAFALALVSRATGLLAQSPPHAAPRPAAAPRVAWTWLGSPPAHRPSGHRVMRGTRGERCEFAYDHRAQQARLGCSDPAGRQLWALADRRPSDEQAALVLAGGVLYAASFRGNVSGATVTAYDAASGTVRWRTPLRGIGPTVHSDYLNEVEMRMAAGYLTAFGWESNGRYIEMVDPATGRTVSNQRLP